MALQQGSVNPVSRMLWVLAGLLAVGVGAVGIVVPGLPTTGFFVLAAVVLLEVELRLEQWVLGPTG